MGMFPLTHHDYSEVAVRSLQFTQIYIYIYNNIIIIYQSSSQLSGKIKKIFKKVPNHQPDIKKNHISIYHMDPFFIDPPVDLWSQRSQGTSFGPGLGPAQRAPRTARPTRHSAPGGQKWPPFYEEKQGKSRENAGKMVGKS